MEELYKALPLLIFWFTIFLFFWIFKIKTERQVRLKYLLRNLMKEKMSFFEAFDHFKQGKPIRRVNDFKTYVIVTRELFGKKQQVICSYSQNKSDKEKDMKEDCLRIENKDFLANDWIIEDPFDSPENIAT